MFSCEVCHKSLKSKDTLYLHKVAAHDGVVQRCKICDKAISVGNLDQHIKAMHGIERFKCIECDFIAKTKRRLTVHTGQRHLGPLEKKFSCKFCDFKGGYQYVINTHVKKSHFKQLILQEAKILKNGTCKYCDYKQINFTKMKQHMIKSHTKQMAPEELISITIEIKKCEFCAYKTYRSDKFKSHVETHKSKKKKVCCKACDFETFEMLHLKEHYKIKHPEKVYFCKSCTFSSFSEANYKRHIKENHIDSEDIYECKLCSFQAPNLYKFNNHYSNVHRYQELFICKICNYSSKQTRSFLRHIERKHHLKISAKWDKNEKICSFCGNKPKTIRSFQLHLYWRHSDKDIVENVTTKKEHFRIVKKTSGTGSSPSMSLMSDISEYIDPEEEGEQISDEEVDNPNGVEEYSSSHEIKNEISDDEEDTASDTIMKIEPKVELTEDFTDQISDDEMEGPDTMKTKQNVSSGLPRNVQYLCPISSCSFSVPDNDKNKRLSHMELRHKNIDSNYLNFIKL